MLPAGSRLSRREDFSATVRRGRRATRGSLVISLLPAGDAVDRAAPLVGFAVSRVVGNAVVRHRTARRLRHLMRDRLGRLPQGSRVVIRALPTAATRSTSALAGDLDAGLDRVLGSRP